ncbi:hypothetical protein [Chondrinema litorale]|uniref:hypothetical protein n=1 Tax=Chondrinema litorale TaxID=2994555 RepID=UPI002542C11E|nr:hypothetical protein [Chondrinema litorale]UZR95944.1 hypothetical protein OQ292_08975 [Chondrinema litorale]
MAESKKTVEELEKELAAAQEAIKEKNAQIKDQEKKIKEAQELINDQNKVIEEQQSEVESATAQASAGALIVTHNKIKYKVIGKTFKLGKGPDAKVYKTADLNKAENKDLLKELIDRNTGILIKQ